MEEMKLNMDLRTNDMPGSDNNRFPGNKTLPDVGTQVDNDGKNGNTFRQKYFLETMIPPINSLVTTREKVYGTISLTIGIAVYLLMFLLLIGFVLAPLWLLLTIVTHGLFLGGLKSCSIRISHNQLPELYTIVERICETLAMPVPSVYITNGEGMFNAFATRLLSRDYVLIYSNILEMAFEQGEAEVAFVLAHELAHVKRRHTKFRFLHQPASLIPFLSTAYSRACESTCDRIAAAICPQGAKWGLVALATGSKIYRKVSLQALYRQVEEEHGFWTWFHEILSTHPNLVKRIKTAGLAASDYNEFSMTSSDNVRLNSLKRRMSSLRS